MALLRVRPSPGPSPPPSPSGRAALSGFQAEENHHPLPCLRRDRKPAALRGSAPPPPSSAFLLHSFEDVFFLSYIMVTSLEQGPHQLKTGTRARSHPRPGHGAPQDVAAHLGRQSGDGGDPGRGVWAGNPSSGLRVDVCYTPACAASGRTVAIAEPQFPHIQKGGSGLHLGGHLPRTLKTTRPLLPPSPRPSQDRK